MDNDAPEKPAPESKAPAKKSGRMEDLVLELNFVPQWAREAPKVKSDVRVRDRGDRDDRGGRRGGGRRDDRRDGRRGGGGGGGDRRRNDRGGGGGGARGGHGGGGRGQGARSGGGGRSGHGGGGDRRGGGGARQGERNDDRRGGGGGDRRGGGGRGGPRRHAPPTMDLRVDFLPVRDRLNKVVEIVRRSKRAFSLMEIASRFADREEFMLAKVSLTADDKNKGKTFFICKSTGVPFLEQSECINHMLRTSLDEFFEERHVDVPPPKGNFPCVGRCTIGGELVGPPNYHGYRQAVEALRRKKYANMSPERFSRSIEQMHEPELVEEWRQGQTKETVYVDKAEIKALLKSQSAKTDAPKEEETEAAAAEPTETEAPATEAEVTDPPEAAAEPPAEAEATSDESATEEGEATGGAETPPADPEPPAASDPNAPSDAEEPTYAYDIEQVKKLSRNQAEVLFRDRYGEKLIKKARKAIFPVHYRRELADSEIYRAVDRALQKEQRFPLTLSFALRPAFRHMKFFLFRASKSHVFVTSVHPNPLAEDAVIPEIREVLQFLRENPGATREILLESLRPGVAIDHSDASAVISPLAWLVERGHVVQFFDGTLAIPKS